MFHMIGALSQYGKLGTVCIADSHEGAGRLYENLVAVLDREARPAPPAVQPPVLPRAAARARRPRLALRRRRPATIGAVPV
jgi:hypothetical protein